MQNDWLDIGDFCIPLALKWRTLIHDWSPALLKFYLNAFQMTLPDQSNLVRWGKGTEKTCYICGKAVGTAKHLLVGCKVLLDSGQYSRRHDRVLEIIRFVREGTRAIKSNVKPYSILKAASDWTIMMDTYEKQYKIPEDICASASRPDIFLYSRILKRVVMIELTVPWETNIPKDHAIKVNKYYELTNELTRNRFVVDLYAVEVGARAFADDLAILTRNPKHCQVLLDEVDKFCEWTDGLRTKPSKCHCLCLGRRNTRYTSYDPGLSLGGQCISTVTENAPFKFLGRKIDNIGRTPSLEGIVDSFLNDLNKLDAGVIKMLKLWLGLALTADSSALFRGSNSFGMSLKRPSELYKHLRVSKRYILGKSHDDIVTSLPKDEDAPELESRLQFHKQFMIGAQSNRAGLGSNRKVQDADILKSFIRQDENDKYKIHAMNLEMQNEWLDIGDFCIPLALKWRTLIYDWSPALLKFYLNAFQMTLPDQSNLVRWGKSTEKTCYICGKAVGTAKHLLVGCKVLLDSGQYSRRHDRVLEVIRFVREGTRATKSNVKPYSILKAASDWTIMMDTYEKQYKIPEDICASASRPDIFLFSRILKRVVMIELTVPWETNIPKDHTIKVNKYYELTNELTRNRFVVDLYAVEVGKFRLI
ncbi:unnamed protein product [Danaus chrysippus]|uniref:(African queen) hypothetical protein n=1 Tax=Danaus chrysippus TaxID=151541 RepID=A0A8J2QUP4_9NEOP|nr:unnamed protein product [Danaus chrysippus]